MHMALTGAMTRRHRRHPGGPSPLGGPSPSGGPGPAGVDRRRGKDARALMTEGPQEDPGTPAGALYDWYVRGLSLLESGNPDAAAHLLERAHQDEPGSASIREALARARFDAGRYDGAAEVFRGIIASNPDDDYAHFGLGLSLSRLGEHASAAENLALAVAMRPQRREYVEALRQVRATLRARGGAE